GALNGRALSWPRGKVLGGCSSINAQMWVRGHPLDYDGWAAMSGNGWSYANVLSYFRRAEDLAGGASAWHGVGGPQHVEDLREPNPAALAFVEAAAAAGIARNPDMNGEVNEGVGLTQVTQRSGRR